MNLSVTLSGEPVTLKSGTFRLEDSIEERAVAELVLVDEGHTVHPRRGQRIKVTSGEGSGTVNSETITVDDAAATVDDTNVTVDGEGETVGGGAGAAGDCAASSSSVPPDSRRRLSPDSSRSPAIRRAFRS